MDKVEVICRAVKFKKKKKRLRAGGEGDNRGWDGFEWILGVGDGQGGLACCHGVTKSQTRLSDWIELNWKLFSILIVMADKAHHAPVKTYRAIQQKEWNNVKYEL